MRTAVWFSNYGVPENRFELPYDAQSPTLFERVRFEDKQDIIDEVYRIINESTEKGFDVGQSMFYQLPFFCNPSIVISDWCWHMITDYFSVTKFNVPISKDLDSMDAWMMDCFTVIENEIQKISNHERKKNGS